MPCYEEQYAQRCLKCNGVSGNTSSSSPSNYINGSFMAYVAIQNAVPIRILPSCDSRFSRLGPGDHDKQGRPVRVKHDA